MALYVRSNKAMGELRRRLLAAGIELSEADVRPTDRFLMERFITGSIAVEISETDASEAKTQLLNPRIKSTEFRPMLSALSFDIETDMKAEQLYSIGVYSVRVATRNQARIPCVNVNVHGRSQCDNTYNFGRCVWLVGTKPKFHVLT